MLSEGFYHKNKTGEGVQQLSSRTGLDRNILCGEEICDKGMRSPVCINTFIFISVVNVDTI